MCLLVLVLALTLAIGCLGPQNAWSLEPDVRNVTPTDSGYRVTGDVSLQGQPEGVVAEGVKIVFLTDDEGQFDELQFGVMDAETSGSQEFDVMLSQFPHHVRVKYDSLDQPDGSSGGAIALRFVGRENGQFLYRSYANYTAEY